MTTEQRKKISSAHIATMKRMEAKFITPIFKALHKQVSTVAEALKANGLTDATTIIDKMLVNDGLVEPIAAMYKLFGAYGAYKTRSQINASVKGKSEVKAGFGINEQLLKEIIAYLMQNILTKAVLPITQTTRDLILNAIIEGQKNGWGADRIAFELERPDMSLSRARMIVRTESLKAMQYGRQKGQQASRWQTESVWISANDHRTRHSHRAVDGDRVDEGKRFAVPIMKGKVQIGVDMMLGPGDITATAGNVINCRCTMATVAKRDENGNLIPKRNISVILPGGFVNTSPVIKI